MIIFRHPRATGTGKNVFRVPFDDDVWVWMAVVSLVLVVGYALILQQEYVLQYHARTEPTVPVNSGKCRIFLQKAADLVVNFVHDLRFIIDSSMLYVGVICQQGAEYAGREKYSGTRFAMVFLFTFSFLMIQFYSASIVGSLLMAPPKNIKTVADLTESSLGVGMQNIVYNYDFFRVGLRDLCEWYFEFVISSSTRPMKTLRNCTRRRSISWIRRPEITRKASSPLTKVCGRCSWRDLLFTWISIRFTDS